MARVSCAVRECEWNDLPDNDPDGPRCTCDNLVLDFPRKDKSVDVVYMTCMSFDPKSDEVKEG